MSTPSNTTPPTAENIRRAVVEEATEGIAIFVFRTSFAEDADGWSIGESGDYAFYHASPLVRERIMRDINLARRDLDVMQWAAKQCGAVNGNEKVLFAQMLDAYLERGDDGKLPLD